MAEVPTGVRIGLHTYTVTADVSGLVGDHAENRGTTHNETLTIAVDARLPRSRLQETLLHEVIHAAWDGSALTAHAANEHEEFVVTALAPLLLGALRDNPRLVAFLVDE